MKHLRSVSTNIFCAEMSSFWDFIYTKNTQLYAMMSLTYNTLQNISNQPLTCYTSTTEESNNTPLIGQSTSSEFRPVEYETWDSTGLAHVLHHSFLAGNEAVNNTKSRADLDLLTKNRGNAMLRYKEKKKYRRQAYSLVPIISLVLFLIHSIHLILIVGVARFLQI